MPRRPRLAIAGIPWHIIQRGNNRCACFYTDDDYRYYLARLNELAKEHQCDIHAYVLMTNHVHLLITPKHKDGASLLMKHLGQRYAQYINRTYRRSGTLWEGRFRSCLTQDETYVLSCYRYIELNPVRANMVADPSDYLWSSYRANAMGEDNDLLAPHYLYSALGHSSAMRHLAYQNLFKAQLADNMINKIRQSTNGNFVLGNEKFKKEIEFTLNQRVSPCRPGRPKRKESM